MNTDITDGSGEVIKKFQTDTDTKSKLDFSTGKSIAKFIASTAMGGGAQSYYFLRNERFKKNRDISNGRIDVYQMFGDKMDMNGKTNYVNLSWKCIKIVNRIISGKIGYWMNLFEKISVTAIDTFSKQQKYEEAEKAAFLLEHGDVVGELEQQSGVPLVPQDQFVPEDKDELDEWVAEFNNLPEEIKSELAVNNIFEINGLFGVIKEKLLTDSSQVGLIGLYTFMDDEGVIHHEWIEPENSLYSNSKYDDLRDTTWRGRVKSMKVSEVRKKYGINNGGKLTEEDIWKFAQTCKEYQLNDNITWVNDWATSYYRPYDEWNAEVIEFEIKSVDSDGYHTKVSKSGTLLIDKENKPPAPNSNKKYKKDDEWNIYRGVYAKEAELMFEWGLKTNMIRPQDPKELGEVEFSYSYFMYQNYNMRNLAIPEKIEEPVEMMILTRLKIQQLIASMTPPGASIDVDAMQELELGLGGATTPMEAQKIWRQSGTLFHRGRDAEGNPIPVPIRELTNSGFMPQMQALIQLYQFHFQVLKDELGDDPNLYQKATQPRVTSGNVEASMQSSDDATSYMYRAYLYLLEDVSRKTACLLQDSIRSGSKAYRHLMKQEEIKDRNFSTKSKMLPTGQDIQVLQAMLNEMLATNKDFCLYVDAFKIMRVAKEDIKLAELLFRNAQKRYLKAQMKIAQQNQEMNAEVQIKSQQSAAASEQEKATQDDKYKKEQILLEKILNMYENTTAPTKEGQSNASFPTELVELSNMVFQSIAMPLMVSNMQTQQAIQQGMQQQGQEQAEQGEQPQQEMQEAPQEQMGEQQMVA